MRRQRRPNRSRTRIRARLASMRGAPLVDKEALDEELKKVRAEIANLKKKNAARPDTHDYSEAATREYFIDLLLKEAGWSIDRPEDTEFEVDGMPNTEGKGYVDY